MSDATDDHRAVVSSGLVRLERGDGQDVTPAYSALDFEEFCRREKEKGLRRDLWDTLPELWEREMEFRAKFEAALSKFTEPNSGGAAGNT